MPSPVIGLIGAGIGSSVIGASAQSKAASNASDAQVQAAQLGVDEQRAAREEMRRLLEPYVAAGGPALAAQMAALGLSGEEAQQGFVDQQANNPIFQALAQQGEDAILQNASATGGLRGGNVQGALAQFRPAMLNQFLEQQYAKLGGMTQLGQNSAAGVGNAGLGVASDISKLLQQAGAARAGGAIAQGNAWGGLANNIGGLAGIVLGGGLKTGQTPGFF
jgi:hypothetical protein